MSGGPATVVVVETPRLALVLPGPHRAAACAAHHHDNAAHLGPWAPPRAPGFHAPAAWAERLRAAHAAHAAGTALRSWIAWRDRPDGPLLGQASLEVIGRGTFLAANLGYGLAAGAEGQGIMTEALRALCAHAFGALGLHRIQANHMPENARSAAVLARLGFVVEGRARDYLYIDGAWRDHVLTSLTNPDPACVPAAARGRG